MYVGKRLTTKELGVNKFDYILFGVIALFYFLFFTHEDIMRTGDNSLSYLMGGNPLKFYSNNFEWYNGYAANYMPTIFIIFAIWNLPLFLLSLGTEALLGNPSKL